MQPSEHTLAHHIQCALTQPLGRHELEALLCALRPYLAPQPAHHPATPPNGAHSGIQRLS